MRLFLWLRTGLAGNFQTRETYASETYLHAVPMAALHGRSTHYLLQIGTAATSVRPVAVATLTWLERAGPIGLRHLSVRRRRTYRAGRLAVRIEINRECEQ